MLKDLEALKNVSDGRVTKIYMPTKLTGVIASLGLAGESLGIGDATPVDKIAKAGPVPVADPCCDDGEKSQETRRMSRNQGGDRAYIL